MIAVNKVVVLLIEQRPGITLEEIEKHLYIEFPSSDYMNGFFSGYLFDSYTVLTLEGYAKAVNKYEQKINNKWVKFITIRSDSDE